MKVEGLSWDLGFKLARDLTRPIWAPQMVVKSKGNPRKFQGNRVVGEILFHLARWNNPFPRHPKSSSHTEREGVGVSERNPKSRASSGDVNGGSNSHPSSRSV